MRATWITIMAAAMLLPIGCSKTKTENAKPAEGDNGKPIVTIEQPPADLHAQVENIRQKLAGADNAQNLGYFFLQLQDVAAVCRSTTDLRNFNKHITENMDKSCGNLCANIRGDVEALFLAQLGSEPRQLTVADRQAWRTVCRAIAWACFNAQPANKPAKITYALPDPGTQGSEPEDLSEQISDAICNSLVLRPIQDERFLVDPVSPADNPARHDSKKNDAANQPPKLETSFYYRPAYYRSFPADDADNGGAAGEGDNAQRGPPADDAPDWLTHSLKFDEAEHQQFMQSAKLFSSLGKVESGAGKVRLLYRAAWEFDRNLFEDEKQTTGDCASHATRNAVDAARAFEILVDGRPYEWKRRGATEAVYGSRGHGGEGMSIEGAVNFVNRDGGLAIRQPYDVADLTRYDSRIGQQWGRSGVPRSLKETLRENQVNHAALVTTLEQARDAIYNGYPLIVGSNVSFSSTRDQDGFAARTPQGWAHAMAWLGVDDTIDSNGPCFLVVNSWERWNKGPKGKYDIPDGSFWIRPDVARYMLSQRQAIAVGEVRGFDQPPLSDFGFDYLTIETPNRLPPEFSGVVTTAVAATLSYLYDPTLPTSANSPPRPDPQPSPGPKPKPGKCAICGGTGWIIAPDGAARLPCECQEKPAPQPQPKPQPEPKPDPQPDPNPDRWLTYAEARAAGLADGKPIVTICCMEHCAPCLKLQATMKEHAADLAGCHVAIVHWEQQPQLCRVLMKLEKGFPQLSIQRRTARGWQKTYMIGAAEWEDIQRELTK